MGLFSKLFAKASLFRKKSISAQTQKNIKNEWKSIEQLLKSKGNSNFKQAIISADKCLDNALRDLVSGDTMGQRLKNAKDLYEWDLYNKIWKAHKMRNNIVHEAGYEVPYHIITANVEVLKKGLKEVGAL